MPHQEFREAIHSGPEGGSGKEDRNMAGKGRVVELNLLVTTSPFPYPDESLVLLILEDISELIQLKGIVPMRR